MQYVYMTHKRYENIKTVIDYAVSKIPAAHNRKRDAYFKKLWCQAIDLEREKGHYIDHEKAVGRDALYYYVENAGSRNYPYYVYRIVRTVVRESDRRSNLVILYR